ncbi:SDR family NAD(P)-dependent oxidoreductase [Chloroflexota bacterium]
MQADFSGKVALVTGSSGGIGRAIALKFAESGVDVVINGRHAAPGREVVRQVKGMGGRAVFEKADVMSYRQLQRMVDRVLDRMGRIDILVASGGRPSQLIGPEFFRETDPADYIDHVKSQWLSRLNCARAVLDHMVERQSGKIIMIGTDGGRVPTPGECLPGGAGAALVMATKVMAAEFARWGIRVNTICVTVTRDTPDLEFALDSPIANIMKKALARQPFPTTSADIAEAALFLASAGSDQITGQILSVNGGLSFPG